MEALFGCHRSFGDSMMIEKTLHWNRAGPAPGRHRLGLDRPAPSGTRPSRHRSGTEPAPSGNRAGTCWDSAEPAPSGNRACTERDSPCKPLKKNCTTLSTDTVYVNSRLRCLKTAVLRPSLILPLKSQNSKLEKPLPTRPIPIITAALPQGRGINGS